MDIPVQVSFMDGEVCEVTLAPGCLVLDLQKHIAELRGVPPSCQQLLVGSDMLDGNENLAAHAFGSGPLLVTMFVSMVHVREMLASAHEMTRIEALEDLRKLGPRGGEESCELALCFLEDFQGERIAAIEALVAVAPKHDERAVGSLAARVLDRSAPVRTLAVEALLCLVEDQVDPAVAAIVSVLKWPGGAPPLHFVWVTEHLCKVARCDPETGVVALVNLMSKVDVVKQLSVVNALSKIAPAGNEFVIEAFTKLLSQRGVGVQGGGGFDGEKVRHAGVSALIHISCSGNALTISTLLACLRDQSPDVRVLALRGLSKLARQGDERVVAAVVAHLGDPAAVVRKAVEEALPKVAEKGNMCACSCASSFFHHASCGVRYSAVKAVESIAHPGDKLAIVALVALFEDSSAMVSKAARDALSTLASDKLVESLCDCVADERAIRAERWLQLFLEG